MKAMHVSVESQMRRLWLLRNKGAFADTGPSRRPRLLVDVSVIVRGDAGTGIQRVVRSVWSHLQLLPHTEFDVVPVYATRHRGYCFASVDFRSKQHAFEQRPVGAREGDCFLGLDLSARYFPNWVGQVDAWRANGAKVHVVVYDLLPRTRPDWFAPATSERFIAWLNSITGRTDQLLCISEEVATELRALVSRVAANLRPQVGRLYLSGDLAGSVPSSGLLPDVEIVLTLARQTPTLLMVGTVEPRKAYDRAISAFDLLWRSSPDAPSLLIIGKPGWETARLQDRIRQHEEFGRRLHWLPEASDEALNQAYAAACALLVASQAEGFGLPLAEAAIHGRWALVRDLPVFREQMLPNVRYFNNDTAEALASSIKTIIALAGQRPPPRATIPSWSFCVERLVSEIGFCQPQRPTDQSQMVAVS